MLARRVQTGMSIACPESYGSTTGRSEARIKYQPAPPAYSLASPVLPISDFPHPSDANDFKCALTNKFYCTYVQQFVSALHARRLH